MLIDQYPADFQTSLLHQFSALPEGAQLYLLLDGLFKPKMFRQLAVLRPILLFASLPGCSEEAKDVSPFVVRYDPASAPLARALEACSGWPMVSAIATHETGEKLAQRLAAWCVVDVDGQGFNFRFPDTRRLPAIVDTLTPRQRAELAGNAVTWAYVGRDGSWQNLPCTSTLDDPPVTAKAELNDAQFARLVDDSEADEMWVKLRDRGLSSELSPSRRHATLSAALELAKRHGVDQAQAVRWCGACIRTDGALGEALADRFIRWISEYGTTRDETAPTIA